MENTPSQPNTDTPPSDVPEPHEEQELLPEHATPDAPVAPVVAAPAVAASDAPTKPAGTNPITAILQWLTYAFWGWVAVALGALVATISHFSLNGYDSAYESVAYVIGTSLVLLPIAFICDVLYSKREEDHKHGIQMVIMVIHAVLFALLAVGALATAVYSLISIALSDTGDAKGPLVFTITAGVLLVFYTIVFVRIIRPAVTTKARLVARLILAGIVVGAIVWGIVGPVAQTFMRKSDERAATAIQTLDTLVTSYVNDNNRLPNTAKEAIDDNSVSYYDKTQIGALEAALDNGSVSYTANTKPAAVVSTLGVSRTSMTYYYQLCVTYQYDDENRSAVSRYYGITADSDGYQEGLRGTSDKAGKHCYDLKTSSYSYVDPYNKVE